MHLIFFATARAICAFYTKILPPRTKLVSFHIGRLKDFRICKIYQCVKIIKWPLYWRSYSINIQRFCDLLFTLHCEAINFPFYPGTQCCAEKLFKSKIANITSTIRQHNKMGSLITIIKIMIGKIWQVMRKISQPQHCYILSTEKLAEQEHRGTINLFRQNKFWHLVRGFTLIGSIL